MSETHGLRMGKEGDYTDEKNEKSKYMLIAKEEGLHCNPA